jgi:hypothetical protein
MENVKPKKLLRPYKRPALDLIRAAGDGGLLPYAPKVGVLSGSPAANTPCFPLGLREGFVVASIA